MAQITAQMVKDLRAVTNAGPLDCKKALEETNGDFQAAVDLLREKGIARANKKLTKGRAMNQGVVAAHQSDDKMLGVIVEVNCETDFVSSNDIFQTFAQNVAEQIAANNPSSIDELMGQPYIANDSQTVEDALKETVAEIGESVEISNMVRFEANGDGQVGIYQHFNKQIAAMVEVSGSAQDTAYDVAMHVSNLKPRYVSRDQVPADVIEAEEKVQLNRALEEGKPQNIAEKIVQGRMGKFYEDIVLLEQPFLKDDSQTIEQVAKGANVDVVNIARFAIGEGEEVDGDDE